jgi:hypothetical protein
MSADGRRKCMGGPSDRLSVPFDVTRGYLLGGMTKTVPGSSARPCRTPVTANGVVGPSLVR